MSNDERARILIIDDEEVVLDSCMDILEETPHEVETARDGTLGLEAVGRFKPDLVFVDLKMPGISGLEVLEKIDGIDATIVTIVITGYATVSSAVEAMKKGAYDYLPKPFTPDQFRLIAKRGLEKRALVMETRALRRERELLRENFAAIVSHELKSPLGSIQQNLLVLMSELGDVATDDQMRRLERMKVRIDDQMKMINRWLRGMTADVNDIRERFKPVALSQSISDAVESVQTQAARKNIEIRTSVPKELPPVRGDGDSLTEALVNVLGNAVKYSQEGGEVIVNARQNDGHILITVSDTGIGIAKSDLPYIFNGAYRGSSGERIAEGSYGLGLAISKKIIHVHGGSIEVESELGKGSTFVMELPSIAGDS
jgi:two-component system sensor histidine kinase/response regulator